MLIVGGILFLAFIGNLTDALNLMNTKSNDSNYNSGIIIGLIFSNIFILWIAYFFIKRGLGYLKTKVMAKDLNKEIDSIGKE